MLEAVSTADPSAIASEFLRPAFRRELTPTWLSTVAALAGQRPLDPNEPLRIVDLRCGAGITAAVIAAAHPAAEIWAGDADPTNVERAERLAKAARLRNLTVVEDRAGEDWHEVAPPSSLDVALLDDVVSTTDDGGRAHIARVLTRLVRPGGLIAVGYRTRIGWSEVIPLRGLALLLAPPGPRPAAWRVRAIVDLLDRLRAGGAGYIVDRPAVSALVELAGSVDGEQLAEILLTENLKPMALVDVIDWLTPVGASFIGSARLDVGEATSSALDDLLDDTLDEGLREVLRDLAARPVYRIDVFRRGATSLRAETRWALLKDLELVGLIGDGRGGADTGDEDRADDAVARAAARLRDGPVMVGELVAEAPANVHRAEQLVRVLMGRGLAHPRSAGWGGTSAAAPCRALNECLAAFPALGHQSVLASPVIGSAICGLLGGPGGPVDEATQLDLFAARHRSAHRRRMIMR